MHKPIFNILNKYKEYKDLERTLARGEGPASVFGLGEGHIEHIISAIISSNEKTAMIVCPNETMASRMCEDLKLYLGNAYHFPVKDLPLMSKTFVSSSGVEAMRLDLLLRLINGEKTVFTISSDALIQRLVPPEQIEKFTRKIAAGDEIDLKEFTQFLVFAGYDRVDACEGKGQFSVRGGIIDVYPINSKRPYRIELWGDEIDMIREYDELSQRSIENVNEIIIPPASEVPLDDEAKKRCIRILKKSGSFKEERELLESGATPPNASILLPLFYEGETDITDYVQDGMIFIIEPPLVEENAKSAYQNHLEGVTNATENGIGKGEQALLLNNPLLVMGELDTKRTAMFFAFLKKYNSITTKTIINFEARAVPQFSSRYEAVAESVSHYKKSGYTTILYAGEYASRLKDDLYGYGLDIPLTDEIKRDFVDGETIIISDSIPKGFEYPTLKMAVLTEYELFGSHSVSAKRRTTHKSKKKPMLVFTELEVGDLVVHELHGIGRFVGVETITSDNNTRDYLKLQYLSGDTLFIPTDQLDRVQKYIGSDDKEPKLSRLGGNEWAKTVANTRASVKKLAFDLVKLYQERSQRKGFKFSEDTVWQRELEDSFPYEETPDQLTCIDEIKEDMQSEKVMDRLLCGDVGYGKTEVALRAAFKAVMDSKQVAFLVPTTILAQQHFNTLSSRFSSFPVNIELLSRFRTAKEKTEILKKLEAGEIDILVGTHTILSDKVKFHDLGLLIIDEEQRFGVGHKEKIKNLKKNIDVLTLTATPIPRTLHMSMTGIRDMSVIETPPEQRYPVQTFVMEFSQKVIREAILKEIGRGGQVFFLYNDVKNMDRFTDMLSKLVPEARFAYANGQMNERALEQTMIAFLENEFDVLICSTIIESGLDIPNANTIIIYDADKLGLAQLYQLRGRVGRGTRLGYAYLTFRPGKELSEVATKRLAAIREFTQFGAGFKVAMRDLEIRGAGNLIGPEQHGHMADVGYDFYCKMIDEAIKEEKGEINEAVALDIDTSIEIPIDAHIPKSYIGSEKIRLSMYKRIASIQSEEDHDDVQDELIDRYGDIPKSVRNLLFIALMKAYCSKAFVTRLQVKEGEIRFTFHKNACLNGEKLFALCKRTPGAQLINGQEVSLVLKMKGATVPDLCQQLPQIVYSISNCIDERNTL